jgi:DNA invertase Pin-like site-specific DNA recombinase
VDENAARSTTRTDSVIAFLYARVSTIDKEQSPEPQLAEMRAYCQARGWEFEEFFEYVSAGKRRPELDRMMAKIRKQKCDVVLCRHFDRIGRSTLQLCSLLEELQARGIQFVSVNQQIDTSTPHGKLMFQMLAAFAEFERAMIRERVLLGMAVAKAKGIRIGRPRAEVDGERIQVLRAEGASLRRIAREFGVSEGKIRTALKSAESLRNNGVLKQ